MVLMCLAFFGVLVGSLVEIVPMLTSAGYQNDIAWKTEVLARPRTYRPLEVMGRDIYVREGCYLCHSQMIRKLPFDVLRYGAASTAEESMWDHPFQWGSKRTGPDLARVGKKYPDIWHYRHMLQPRDVVAQSIMPAYPWLANDGLEFRTVGKKMGMLRRVGVPYSDAEIGMAEDDAREHASRIAAQLVADGAAAGIENKEVVALIAYLQALGQMQTTASKAGGN